MNNSLIKRFETKRGASISIRNIEQLAIPLLDKEPLHSEFRKKQVSASNWMLQNDLGIQTEIVRQPNGYPTTKSAGHLSISHTKNLLAVIHHQNVPVAIDIEKTDRDIRRLVSKFTCDEELHVAAKHCDLNTELFIWSCKECLFKVLNTEGVHFKTQLKLVQFDEHNNSRSLWRVNHPNFQGNYWINWAIFDELLLTYIDEPAQRDDCI